MAARIDVAAMPSKDGWDCRVTIDDGRGTSTHRVAVRGSDLDRLAPGAADPVALVRASVEFLLEREPKESILGSFDLPVIGRYYPDYERSIRRGAGG